MKNNEKQDEIENEMRKNKCKEASMKERLAKKRFDLLKKKRGSATIEYSMLLPLLLFISLLVLWVVFSIHDRAVLQAIANEKASNLAGVWRNGSDPYNFTKSGDWSYEAIDKRDMYWQLDSLLSNDKNKTKKIEAQITEYIQTRSWLPSNKLTKTDTDTVDVQVECVGGIPWATIYVDIQLVRQIPLSRYIKKTFWNGQIITRVSASALVTDSKSLIQDTDWAIQALQKTEVDKVYDRFIVPIRTWYKKIK